MRDVVSTEKFDMIIDTMKYEAPEIYERQILCWYENDMT